MSATTASLLGVQLSQRVRDLRVKAGMSQADLAEVLGVGQPTISLMERRGDRAANFNVTTLEQLAWALGVELVIELRERP